MTGSTVTRAPASRSTSRGRSQARSLRPDPRTKEADGRPAGRPRWLPGYISLHISPTDDSFIHVVEARSRLDPKVRRVFGERGAIVRASRLLAAGVHPRTLYELRDSGQLEAVGRGLYRLPSAPLPEHFDLLVVAARASRAVVCLISALAFHELTDEIPHEVSIAIPRGSSTPRIDATPVRVFHFSGAMYELGIEHHQIDGVDVKIYSPAKSIVDVFRLRNRIGEDLAIKALATGLRTRKVRPGPILELAGKLRARRVIEPYLKALA